MVGTAEYQVTPYLAAVCQNAPAENFAGTTTAPPVCSVDRVAPIRPWT